MGVLDRFVSHQAYGVRAVALGGCMQLVETLDEAKAEAMAMEERHGGVSVEVLRVRYRGSHHLEVGERVWFIAGDVNRDREWAGIMARRDPPVDEWARALKKASRTGRPERTRPS